MTMNASDLKRLRTANGLTQSQLADIFNAEFETTLTKRDISQWEGSIRKMNKLHSFAFNLVFDKMPKK